MKLIKSIAALFGSFVLAGNVSAGITESMVFDAQDRWGKGIVQIGRAKIDGGDYRAAAAQHIKELYDYQHGPVLFKPTKAKYDQFRQTFEEAHSYFVKGIIKEDGGFAINPWKKVRFENHKVLIDNDMALAMGNYYFTTIDNQEVKVEYTFGYRLDDSNQLKIVLHHSSLPFS